MKKSKTQSNLVTRNSKLETELGQTIIETVVGIFILIMGITSALGLANFSLASSTIVSKQIIGSGLAREGLEAVKSMRDSNWLRSPRSSDCRDWSAPTPATYTASCYKLWLNPGTADGYNISGSTGAGQAYTLDFDPTAVNSNVNFWTLTPVASNSNFNLYIDNSAKVATVPNAAIRFYRTNATGGRTSEYWRRITIIQQRPSSPYDDTTGTSGGDTGPRLLVRSEVWWTDKKCSAPASGNYDFSQADAACRISLETYLTNWKAY